MPRGILGCGKLVTGIISVAEKFSGPSRCNMAERQWASKGLVGRLVKQEKYELAAYVVLGAKTVFEMYSRWIADTVAKSRESSENVCRQELAYIIELAKDECRYHRKWQDEVLSSLPGKSDALGLTGPLRLAFADAADLRKRLLQQVMLAHGEFLDSQNEDCCADENVHAAT